MREQGLHISISERDGHRVVAISGEFDVVTAPKVKAVLIPCLNAGPVVVDLTGCSFIDATAFSTLIAIRRRAAELGERFVAVGTGRTVTLWSRLRLGSVIDLFQSLENAFKPAEVSGAA